MAHGVGEALRLFPVGLDFAAEIGVSADQIVNGRVVVGLGLKAWAIPAKPGGGAIDASEIVWRLRHNTARQAVFGRQIGRGIGQQPPRSRRSRRPISVTVTALTLALHAAPARVVPTCYLTLRFGGASRHR